MCVRRNVNPMSALLGVAGACVLGACLSLAQARVPGSYSVGTYEVSGEVVDCDEGEIKCALDTDPKEVSSPGATLVFDNIELGHTVPFTLNFTSALLETDFYLLCDTTTSMNGAIATAKAQFKDLVDYFDGQPDVRFGVGSYRDEAESNDGFTNLQGIASADLAQSAIGNLATGDDGNYDRDEANLVALYKVATDPSIGWRDRARKLVVVFGDNPGHEPSCTGGKKLTRTTVVDALNAKKITVIAVSFGNPGLNREVDSEVLCGGSAWDRPDSPAGSGQATFITEKTNGVLEEAQQQEQLIEAILQALKTLPRVFDADTSDCGGNIVSTYDPALPLELRPGESAVVKQVVSLTGSICDEDEGFTCTITYTESGGDLPPLEVEVKNVIGC